MKRFLNFKTSLFLLGIGFFALFGCEAELVESEELVDVQEAFSRATNVTIKGTIKDPVTDAPIKDAIIRIGHNQAISNSNGDWILRLRETGPGAVVNVIANGRVDFVFPASFRQVLSFSTINWDIELPLLQPDIEFEPGEEATSSYTYDGVVYTVTIPGDVIDEPTKFTVGPGATVVGSGISGAFAVVGVDYDDDDDIDSEFATAKSRDLNGENYELGGEIEITYNPLEAAQSNGIGSINPVALEDDAPAGAQEAAQDVLDAIDAALDALASGASPFEVALAFVLELYGLDIDEVEENEDGTITIQNCIEGTLQPGTGDVTDTGELVEIGEDCQNGEPVPLADGNGEVINIPHQGTADAG